MTTTAIEWTDKVWNPVTGCNKVSQGCKHCYAETIAGRFWAKQYPPNADGTPRKFTDVRCHPDRLEQPLHWKKPARVFVNSMSDLFHDDVPFEFVEDVFNIMARTPEHTYQILTKRPQRMADFINAYNPEDLAPLPLPNVWLGVSVENQQAADERIPWLLKTPAAVRFLSCEPLLSFVDLEIAGATGRGIRSGAGPYSFGLVDWVIAGGESGPNARPMKTGWVQNLRSQCAAAGVPFFMKQLGGHPVKRDQLEDFPAELRVREFPE